MSFRIKDAYQNYKYPTNEKFKNVIVNENLSVYGTLYAKNFRFDNLEFDDLSVNTISATDGSFNNISINNELIFKKSNNIIFSCNDFSSNNQGFELPSVNNQPISLERKSIFINNNTYNLNNGNNEAIIPLSTIVENQLNLQINGNIVSPLQDISGQYVELYANFLIQTSNNVSFSFDISGIDCSFFEIIDERNTTKKNEYYLTFGPHIFLPSEWINCSQFVFKVVRNNNNSFSIKKSKFVFKSSII